jgi:hypothetical protein
MMNKSIGLLSHFAFALVIVAALSASVVARGDAHPAQQRPRKSGTSAGTTHTAESDALLRKDNVLATQNCSQAMAIEAENGKLPAAEEDELKRQGYIKQVAADQKK